MNPYFTQVPPAACRRGERVEFVRLLRTRPGHWAQYKPDREHSISGASQMKFDFPGVDVATRRRPEGGHAIYARWVGTNGDHP